MIQSNKCLFCYTPILDEVPQAFHPKCSNIIFGKKDVPILDLNLSDLEVLAQNMLQQYKSVTGVQKKMSLGIEEHKTINRFTIRGLMPEYILKPSTAEYPFLPEIEDLTMHLAQIMGLQTAKHTLIRLASGELAYLTKRFDRENGQKYAVEDMCQLSGKLTEDKYRGSMEQIGKLMKYATYPNVEKIRLYELTLFCFLTGNADMHLKNFSLITDKNEKTSLSPAYDLVATSLLMPQDSEELALNLNGKKRKLNGRDFSQFAKNLKIDETWENKIKERFLGKIPSLVSFIKQSFLPDDLQEQYIVLVQSRAENIL